MPTDALSRDLSEWATASARAAEPAPDLDRTDPGVLSALKLALADPRPIEEVEQLEWLAKLLWRDTLGGPALADAADSSACADFFSALGFLFKYKPYGLKMASPFGYTVFDLADGAGFSFQVHIERKLEAFHIIGPKSESLAYISSTAEWEAAGAAWARAYFDGSRPDDVRFVRRPAAGDVIEIDETLIVHTVLGCLLEEYASCSVDAVDRLLDQNVRSVVDLPARNPDPAEVLRGTYADLPRVRLRRTDGGWAESPIGPEEPIISVPNELFGARRTARVDTPSPIEPSDRMVTLIVASAGDLISEIEGAERKLRCGDTACLLPGMSASITASEAETVFSIHQVSRDLVLADWTR